MLAQLALATLTDRAKAQHAERKGFAFQNPPTSHMRKFETPASKITNNTRSILETGNDAISGGIRESMRPAGASGDAGGSDDGSRPLKLGPLVHMGSMRRVRLPPGYTSLAARLVIPLSGAFSATQPCRGTPLRPG